MNYKNTQYYKMYNSIPIADKFNIITPIDNKHLGEIINKYIINYFEYNINIYHPDYIHQIIWTDIVDKNTIQNNYNIALENCINTIQEYIRLNINNKKFSLKSLNKLLIKYEYKIKKIIYLLNINNTNYSSKFIIKLFSDPILINFLEMEFTNINKYNIAELKIFYSIIEIHHEYIWILKLIGTSLKKNILTININPIIPYKYQLLYHINYIIQYTQDIKILFNFMHNKISLIINQINEILYNKIILVIQECTLIELYNLIKFKYDIIKELISNINFKIKIQSKLTLYINTIDLYNLKYNEMYIFLKLLSKCLNLQLIDTYILLLFENCNINDILLDIIHNYINKMPKFIKQIIPLLKNIKNQDIFFDKYHTMLIQRLLSNQTKINNEKIILHDLQSKFNSKLINKIEKVIYDICASNKQLDSYHNITKKNMFNVIITSYAYWKINYNQGYVNIDSKDFKANNSLTDYIIEYQNYYKKTYFDTKKIIWLLQYGEINITYNKINIIVLPLQLLILELFNNTSKILIIDIQNQPFFINYSTKYKNEIINSLIYGKILIKNDQYLELTQTNDIAYNFIDIYMNTKLNTNNNQVESNLAHSRIDIIKCLIIHFIKIESKDEYTLFQLIENKLKHFQLTKELFNNAIEHLLKFDYIVFDGHKYNLCLY